MLVPKSSSRRTTTRFVRRIALRDSPSSGKKAISFQARAQNALFAVLRIAALPG
jgi:hypothetical protein